MSHQSINSPPTQSNDEPSQSDSKAKLLPVILGFGAVIVFMFCAFLSGGTESIWTSALLSLPVIAQVIGSIILWHRVNVKNIAYYTLNMSAASACILSYCLLWLVYSRNWLINHPDLLQDVSLFALVLIALLLCFVGVMTAAFIMASNDTEPKRWLPRQCEDLRAGIKDEPLWAIALFFILFLGVAYLFGFALAFHDQYALSIDYSSSIDKDKDQQLKRPALRMVNLKSIDDPPENGSSPTQTDQAASRQGQEAASKESGNTPSQTPQVDNTGGESEGAFCFYFRDGEAHLSTKTYSKCTGASPPDRTDANPRKPEEFNDCSLKALVKRIQDETEGNRHIRVVLIGHTSKEPVGKNTNSPSFFSNYELSEARSENVKFEVLRLFDDTKRWHNVEWSILPASNEPLMPIASGLIRKELFTQKELEERLKVKDTNAVTPAEIEKQFTANEIVERLGSEEQRIVAAVVERIPDHVTFLQMDEIHRNKGKTQFKSLRLMDYMYFSIYTITTTGYGDIVPTTAYAKFVTSLANVCEVLFLVVFFNALISIKGDREHGEMARILDFMKAQKEAEKNSGKNSKLSSPKFGSGKPFGTGKHQ